MIRKILYLSPFFLLVILTFLFSGETVYAEAGDFYDRHEDFIEENIPSESMREIIEKYDYETNDFDCEIGITTMFGKVGETIYCYTYGLMFTWTVGLIKASFVSSAESVVVTAGDISNNPIFTQYKNGLSTLSIWMLSIFVMWNIAKLIALRYADPEDTGVALNESIVKLITISIVLGVYDQLFALIMKFQQFATQAVLSNPVDMEEVVLTVFKYGAEAGMFLALIVAGIMFIFQIAFMYRFVLFGLLYITGVIAIPTGMNEEYNYFSLWLRLLITNGITLFLQAIAFGLGVNAMFVQNAFNNGTAFVTAMAFFILALAIPSLLGQMGASSGTGKALGSIVRVASRRVR